MSYERIRINGAGTGFLCGDKPFFYFADTAWSAFTNLDRAGWIDYLDRRAAQGFNFLQINLLPQWDRSRGGAGPEPFLKDGSGGPAWDKPNPEYFDAAERFTADAAERGLRSALVLLWCDYVPGTWAAKRNGGPTMPLEAVEGYVAAAARRFLPYAPIYLASGDTDYPAEAIPHYAAALRTVKRVDPEALTTLHSQPNADPAPELVAMEELDFYMYQSGHLYEEQWRTWDWPRRFARYPKRRPAVNGEPCYDGHKHGMKSGRFSGIDVRRAFFQSVLSGASAGFTYGAHGIWNFHRPGDVFPSVEFSGTPFAWRTALGFPGAEDAAFCVRLFEDFGMADLEPLADAAADVEPWFLAAAPDRSRFALYLSDAAEAAVPLDASAYACRAYYLAERNVGVPRFVGDPAGSRLKMGDYQGDVLILGRKL